jgi:hypothetical protein
LFDRAPFHNYVFKERIMTRKLLLILFLIGFSSTFVSGQVAISGQIRGVVTDSQGASIPNVSITAKSPAMMASRTLVTDASGGYLFESLPPGSYELTYSAPGFTTQIESHIAITPGFTATISVKLPVGSTEQSVVVSAESQVVDTANNTTSTTFDDALLQGIPSGRDTFSTVAQAPGVAKPPAISILPAARAFNSRSCKSTAVFPAIRSTALTDCD